MGRGDDDRAATLDRLGVRPARVVDVARHVPALGAVDGPARVDLEHVAGAARFELVRLRIADAAAAVRDDVLSLPERLDGVEAEPGFRAADSVFTIWHGVHLGKDSRDRQNNYKAPWTKSRYLTMPPN